MGSPKALLTIGGRSFLHHVIDVLQESGVDDIVIVLGADADEVRRSLSWFHGSIVVNQNWRSGQLSSLTAGLDSFHSTGIDGILVWPVDRPLITSGVVKDLIRSFHESGKSIVVPVYGGRRGHPTFFSSTLFDELRNAPLNVGAKHVLLNHPHDIHEVHTQERGVVLNIDTPEDYEANVKR
jgi:molybdenum cofactor cytidylyltransferase